MVPGEQRECPLRRKSNVHRICAAQRHAGGDSGRESPKFGINGRYIDCGVRLNVSEGPLAGHRIARSTSHRPGDLR